MALVILCAIISSLFIWVYNPLNIDSFYINTRIGDIISVKWAGVIGSATLIFTEMLLRPFFKLDRHTRGSLVLWAVFELVLISIVIYLCFGERGRPLWEEFLLTSKFTFILSIVPYTISCLLILIWQQQKESQPKQVEKSTMLSLLTFRDENDRNPFLINPSDILYLKADDNYVQVFFINGEKIEKRLIRNRLKAIEEQLENSPLIRIHRSFMINQNKIRYIDQSRGKITISLFNLPAQVFPVSPSYRSSVIDYKKITS
jgi:hypothetical protein